jgi:hypothetical protein
LRAGVRNHRKHPEETVMEEDEISDVKFEANRRNAEKSTGPRTEKGKAKSRWNALKHGLTAKTTVLPGVESKGEFKKLLRGYLRHYKPKGTPEKSLVQRLAACDLRVQRAIRAERSVLKEGAGAFVEGGYMPNFARHRAAAWREFEQTQKSLHEVQDRRKNPT